MASNGVVMARVASKGGHKWYRVRWRMTRCGERVRERSLTSALHPLSASNRGCFDLMSPWYSAAYAWSEPFDSGSGRRRGRWWVRSEDEWYWLTSSAGKWWSQLAPNDVEGRRTEDSTDFVLTQIPVLTLWDTLLQLG